MYMNVLYFTSSFVRASNIKVVQLYNFGKPPTKPMNINK